MTYTAGYETEQADTFQEVSVCYSLYLDLQLKVNPKNERFTKSSISRMVGQVRFFKSKDQPDKFLDSMRKSDICNACPQRVSWQGNQRRSCPMYRHILRHCIVRIADTFPIVYHIRPPLISKSHLSMCFWYYTTPSVGAVKQWQACGSVTVRGAVLTPCSRSLARGVYTSF